MDIGSQEVGVINYFQLNWFVVEPFLIEFLYGWMLEEKFWEDAKAVVDISFQKELMMVVGVPQVVAALPLEFPDYDGDAA